MNKKTVDALSVQAEALLKVPFACLEAKEAAQKWLKEKGGKDELKAAKALIQEMKEDIMPIDGLIAFASSKDAKEHLGEKEANAMLAEAKETKKKGGKYCTCDACKAAANIIALEKDVID